MVQPSKTRRPARHRVTLPERITNLPDLRPLGAKGWRLVATQVARETRRPVPAQTGTMR